MINIQCVRGLAGSSRSPGGGGSRQSAPRVVLRATASGAGAERTPPRPRHPNRAHQPHQHAPAPASALPEHRASASRLGGASATSRHGTPALRSLALSTVALPRQQLEERYGHAFAEAATAAVEKQQETERRRRAGPAGLPHLLPLPRALTRQLALYRRQQQRAQQQGKGKEQEASMSQEALTLVLLATAVSFICSIDRAAMSVAILPMSEQFHWDDSTKGVVSSAFFAGYMITNLCGGFLATRYSAKTVLASGVVLWSLFTIATPQAASTNLGQLMLARAMMGVGEGVTYPSIQNLVRKWVPDSKRSRALAFIYSGHQLGTIGSYLLCPLLISQLGWESVFWIFGSLGFVWLMGWQPLVKDDPSPAMAAELAGQGAGAAQPTLASSSAAAVAAVPVAGSSAASEQSVAGEAAGEAVAAQPLRLQDVPWGQFAGNSAFWAIVAAQCTVSVGNVLAFSWLPTFYNQVYGVDIAASSAYSVLPFVVTVGATNAAGWIADGLVNNKILDKTNTRKLMQGIASVGPAFCLLKLAADQGQGSTASVTDAVGLVTAWVSLGGFAAAGYGANHQDISKQYSGILYGLSNGLASVAASVSIYATGQVLYTTHDWSLVFEVAAGLYAVGAVAYLKWASSEEQFAPREDDEAGQLSAAGQLAAGQPKSQR